MKKPRVIAVVGGKNSGKTTAIEALTTELTRRGYKIAAVKHISEPNFTIDSVGKDTWRFAKSGAKTIISVASNEITTIEKRDTTHFSLSDILSKSKDHDIVFIEGFKSLVSKNAQIPKIVAIKSSGEIAEALKVFSPILAFTGPYSPEDQQLEIPYADALHNAEEIADIVEKALKRS